MGDSDPITARRRAPVDSRPAVTVLAGFSPAATTAVARLLQRADPRLVSVSHDLGQVRDGVIRRVVRTSAEVLEDEVETLLHGCVSCTLREDVLPTLVRLSRTRPESDIVLLLPRVVEPEAVAGACAHCEVGGRPVTDAVRFDSYVTVVDAASLLTNLTSADDLRDRDLHAAEEDDRAVADVITRQIEFADTVVLWGGPEVEGFDLARAGVLLERLAPWATQVAVDAGRQIDSMSLAARLRHTGRHNPRVPGMNGRALEGYAIAVHSPEPDCGVVSVLFEARRPFHPARLHGALGTLAAETLRGRGQLWLASQPDTVIAYESAGGGVGMGSLGRWLAAQPAYRWAEATPDRRAAADLGWDAFFGDRRTVLAFVGLDFAGDALTERLAGCLLTNQELATDWTGLQDPFAGCFPLTED
ncbi:CobW family GTP-binding protein [Asanoa iriomotensis]|uniref:Cobalamin synthesis protein CobW n=1 Tax=Asanoa iriomotensis TaxID=234613 RepID=A0ABQ4C3M5_9ACTN|nr:GTP-binding protein [Asanoa iriomotensis]GIF57041.1 cobalamin synthesis protein CobW [Asanoa iriomotensis]